MPPVVARAHNGSVEGARFPGEPVGAPRGADPDIARHRPGRRVRVLVVDDDARVRAAIGQTIALEIDLLMVAGATNAAEAMALAQSAKPPVALVDVLLPDATTGLALVRHLAQRQGCAVVAMSVGGGLRSVALAAGAIAFVEKGADIDALLHAIRTAYVIAPRPPPVT
jgi:DNA-binding NtrC family response regulator